MTTSPIAPPPRAFPAPIFTVGSALRWLGHDCPDHPAAWGSRMIQTVNSYACRDVIQVGRQPGGDITDAAVLRRPKSNISNRFRDPPGFDTPIPQVPRDPTDVDICDLRQAAAGNPSLEQLLHNGLTHWAAE
jgi:hypothetical protein